MTFRYISEKQNEYKKFDIEGTTFYVHINEFSDVNLGKKECISEAYKEIEKDKYSQYSPNLTVKIKNPEILEEITKTHNKIWEQKGFERMRRFSDRIFE